jgi:hypothetical protein
MNRILYYSYCKRYLLNDNCRTTESSSKRIDPGHALPDDQRMNVVGALVGLH